LPETAASRRGAGITPAERAGVIRGLSERGGADEEAIAAAMADDLDPSVAQG
jgi:hypothetical protein